MPGYLAGRPRRLPRTTTCASSWPDVPGESVEVSADGWTGLVDAVDVDGDWPADAEEVIVDAFGPDAIDGSGRGIYLLARRPATSTVASPTNRRGASR